MASRKNHLFVVGILISALGLIGLGKALRENPVAAVVRETTSESRGREMAAAPIPGPENPAKVVAPASDAGAASDLPEAESPPSGAEEQAGGAAPATSLADILEELGDLSDPATRRLAVERMQQLERERRSSAAEWARQRGLPLRIERPDGTVQELVALEGGRPVYFTTHNVNAALSTGASVLRVSPYGLSGAGVSVGVWDGGSARATHQEFAVGERVLVRDASASIDHATHVAGTIAGEGVVVSARGMAPAARIDSYDWNGDKSEMTAQAAALPGEAGKLYLSNHSYGYVSGWNYVAGGNPYRLWEWTGNGTTAGSVDQDLGRYNTYARDSDALAFSASYYLMFRSAGNDRTENPSAGQLVALAPGSTTVVAYDAAAHPAGDGVYRGGFETIGFDALAKNVVTVGSITDAVTSGVRDPAKANMSAFSSWGPTDDGRIKPDLVANGDGVYSALNASNSAYGIYSGTSMATPNAVGTAALLIEQYSRLFPGGALRSSSLKGLLIHTADDRGQTGPDYKFGWGLLNGPAAAELLIDHAAHPLKTRLTEDTVTSTRLSVGHEFVWDGVSPLRVTLAWTDPAGTATTTTDLRTPRLRNNLDLVVISPGGAVYQPFVMPFVGTWTQAAMDLPATTGKNNTDNVEQVLIPSPPVAGVYRAVVSYEGTLANNTQTYSLLISGSANEVPPPPPLTVTGITPASALAGSSASVELAGFGFRAGAVFRLSRPGSADRVASSVQLVDGRLNGRLDLAGATPGLWNVVVTNPESGGVTESFTLPDAFTVISALWSETFDGTVSGWASAATTGSNTWTLTTSQSHTPASAYFATGPATKSTVNLTSPAVAIPAGASSLQLKFWHRFELAGGGDGGRLELSVDGGATWFDVTDPGSGASFASNGYNARVTATGPQANRSEFAGLSAWTGSSGGFVETIVNLTDTTKFAGKNLRARWRLATNASGASTGWFVDTISLLGGTGPINNAPVIDPLPTSLATSTTTDPDGTVFGLVAGRQIGISVGATDDGGAAALSFTWSATNAEGVPVSFQPNGTAAAAQSTAYFEGTGDYLLTVTVKDAAGLTSSASTRVRVMAVAEAVGVVPAVASVVVGGLQQFAATVLDQFGEPLSEQPGGVVWSVSGGGGIDANGAFVANAAGGPFAIGAAVSGQSGVAAVTVIRAPANVELGGLARTYDGEPKSVLVTTTPAGLAYTVTYNGVEQPPSAVGEYAVEVVVSSPNYQGGASGILVIATRRFVLTLAASPVDGGSVSGAGEFDEGTLASIEAAAAPGWRFIGWSGADADIGNPAALTTTVRLDGNQSVTAFFTPLSGYEKWAALQENASALSDPLSDPDGDGASNLLEYALGGAPFRPDAGLVETKFVQGVLGLSFGRVADPELVYTVQATDDLSGTWETVTAEGNPSTGEANTAGSITIMDTKDAGASGRRFLRLRVDYGAPGGAMVE
jgi:hypothetical protein